MLAVLEVLVFVLVAVVVVVVPSSLLVSRSTAIVPVPRDAMPLLAPSSTLTLPEAPSLLNALRRVRLASSFLFF